ncbi:MAG: aldehyde:ferredoxin oxidoreductase [Spirochaetae bacterium HGW-Spirochaetae-1]|nr:MAG: aldehyde:ferredoxin oxidoreductase [Spirochaetae bacterium HGW-Spirochaetae-1]
MASKFKGYMGKMLDINLTEGTIGEYNVSDKDRELFLGGRYLSTKILWDELKSGIDPMSDDNILVVMTSPLTGTGAPSSSRYDISAKSPLTGAIGHSNSGGNFGIFLKKAGWDGMLVRGRSKQHVYIEIEDDNVQIKNADHLWGMNTQDAQAAMGKGGTMAIGPAGEHLVKFATVVSQERSHGRTGMGAVMGYKNLKGMVARGSKKHEIEEPEKYKEHIKKWIKLLQGHPATGDQAPKLGTAGFLTTLSVKNALPTKNFSRGSYEDAYMIGGERLADEFLVKNYGCTSCPIRCGRVVNIDGKDVKGPEYEILCLLGSNMLINDMEAILRWNMELDHLGIDAITVGTLIGFAAELNEKGMWKTGIEFGKKDNISEILRKIAYREGIGNDLAEGVRFLSEKYGGKDFAPHAKGLELAAYEPRASVGHGLGYATASRGGCHLDGGYLIFFEATGPVTLDQFHYRSKPGWVTLDQDLLAVISAAGNCLFTSWTFVPGIAYKAPGHLLISKIITKVLTYSWPLINFTYTMPKGLMKFHLPMLPHTKAINYATGMKMDFGKFMMAGARGYTMEKLFNLREGIDKEFDTLAKRFTDVPLLANNKKSVVRLDKMIPKYYKLRGWDKNGIPKKKTLKKMGIDFVDVNMFIKK